MKKLIEGIVDFRENKLTDYLDNFGHLVHGQFPDTLFIACSDSRVVPNVFASTDPGDLFVIRNLGNLIPDFKIHGSNSYHSEWAAFEFSLNNLPISDVVICGHSECGAMQAVIKGIEHVPNASFRSWLENCDCQLEHPDDNLTFDSGLSVHNRLAQKNVLQQIKHLKNYPLIQDKIKDEGLNIHGWYFDIGKGDVYSYEEEFNQFILIDETEARRILKRLQRS